MYISRKFNNDLLWNVGSLAILALSGILSNILIIQFYDAEYLGVYNQVFAVYIFFSQFAVGGIHLSVLKELSYFIQDKEKFFQIICSALILGTVFSTLLAFILFYFSQFISNLLASEKIQTGLLFISPGLIFFSINKILLNALNGLNYIKEYAIFQALRYVFIFFLLFIICSLSLPGEYLPFALTISEFFLTIILLSYIFTKIVNIRKWYKNSNWVSKHLSFGLKSFMGGALIEMNTRIDVIFLGYFLTDKTVGIYSFAAMLAEGVAQFPVLIRRNLDPLIGDCFSKKTPNIIEEFSSKLKFYFPLTMFFISVIISSAVYIYINYFPSGYQLQESLLVLILIFIGVIINSIYRPFSGIFLQGNKPGYHTLISILIISFNATGNFILIPKFGIFGAAIATSLVYILEGVLIKFFSKKLFKIKL
ncbi:MAG: hypothetical protein CMG55_03460 [Candidatus Marinimicrobia bacterium]|nr:hypothetical protein [Candidatus Neomarinimicrobiota bacterium]